MIIKGVNVTEKPKIKIIYRYGQYWYYYKPVFGGFLNYAAFKMLWITYVR